jgi:hypothetical protein
MCTDAVAPAGIVGQTIPEVTRLVDVVLAELVAIQVFPLVITPVTFTLPVAVTFVNAPVLGVVPPIEPGTAGLKQSEPVPVKLPAEFAWTHCVEPLMPVSLIAVTVATPVALIAATCVGVAPPLQNDAPPVPALAWSLKLTDPVATESSDAFPQVLPIPKLKSRLM